MSKYYGVNKYQNDDDYRHVYPTSIVGMNTNANMYELRKELPGAQPLLFNEVEEAVASMYDGPDSIDFRLEGKDKADAERHMKALDENYHFSYREYLVSEPEMTDASMSAMAKYYEMDDFYKKLLDPKYRTFDPNRDKEELRSMGQDIQTYKKHLTSGDFTRYPFTDNYRYFSLMQSVVLLVF